MIALLLLSNINMKMKRTVYMVALLVALMTSATVKAQKKTSRTSVKNNVLTMLVGTYTEGSKSEGVYVYRFDQSKGTATKVSSAKAGNPSYVTATNDNRFAYAVNEYGDGRQGVTAFRLDKKAGRLTKLNSCSTATQKKGGEDPCYILTNGKEVVTANYSGGDITVFPVAKDGSLRPMAQRFSFTKSAAGSPKAHLHCVRFSPDGKYLFADDLGNDCIYRFNVNAKGDFLSHQTVAFRGKLGMGPRHLTFSADGRHAYLINELGGIVVAFSYNNGSLTPIQTIMADEGEGHGSADIHISPDGRFLYTSHRLKKDGVAIFSIDKVSGKLTKVGYQLTSKHPRNFNITPNGKYVLVACRDSNAIEVYLRNAKTGMLIATKQTITIDKPVCVCFLK
jgi:6-phosphogluconolactonase